MPCLLTRRAFTRASQPSGKPSTRAPDREPLKAAAAARAAQLVEDGMLLGLGTGTTAGHFVQEVGALVAGGMRVWGVPTSNATAALASELRIPMVEAIDRPIDLAVDGADEIDTDRSLVKGRGGALFREKLVAVNSRRFVVIADESKLVSRLGTGTLPVEILPFLWRQTAVKLEDLGCTWSVRGGEDAPYRTDNGNLILDLRFAHGVVDAAEVAARLKSVIGVVEHGLYVGLVTACIVAGREGISILGSLD